MILIFTKHQCDPYRVQSGS